MFRSLSVLDQGGIYMLQFTRGVEIGLPCKVFPGAFSHESHIVIETVNGEVSGFVKNEELLRIEENTGYVRAIIVDEDEDTITVSLNGSFFTTTGIAHFARDWAQSNAELVAA